MSVRLTVVTDPEKTKKLGTLLRIMGNAGLEEKGEEPDLTDKWVLRNIKPGTLIAYALTMYTVINEGNRIEDTRTEKEKGPVDEGLEEENAKKQPGN